MGSIGIAELAIGGFTAVPDDDPGVVVGDAGPSAGPLEVGCPLPAVRLVVHPNAVSVQARETTARSRMPLSTLSFIVVAWCIWPPSVIASKACAPNDKR